MDESEKEKQPSIGLPPVEGSAISMPPIESQGSERNPELLSSTQGQAMQQMPAVGVSAAPEPPVQASAAPSPAVAGSSPMIADDVDLIEKEWVEKAKEIVEKTKDNPYLQNKAMSEFKADYIKKRYNKDLGQPDTK